MNKNHFIQSNFISSSSNNIALANDSFEATTSSWPSISVPMFWSNGYCLFVYNNATIHHHYYYIFLFSETHLFRVLLTSDYLDIKGDQWKRRSLTEEDAFRELVHWCCCCCAPRSWLCRSLHTTNISASWHPPCCCCVCAPLCTQCIAECSSSIFTPSFPPPPPFPSTAAAMAAILHLLMPLEHNAAFLTHKLHSEGKWQNWMRHNLEGNNFVSASSRKNAPSTGFWWRAFFLKTKLVLGY